MMILKQPFFLLGLNDIDECKDNAFGAMWMFILTFTASVFTVCYDSTTMAREVDHRSIYGEREDRPILPPGMSSYRVNSEVELSTMDVDRDFVPDYEMREII
mmetsp:Transcript_2541/g.3815  ORF Transcript_2541/g.3815 Transcript_2541/m.3815 type:complete len:102 (-) Transcript_2541:562-867(-)